MCQVNIVNIFTGSGYPHQEINGMNAFAEYAFGIRHASPGIRHASPGIRHASPSTGFGKLKLPN